jgi:hypothetical protein
VADLQWLTHDDFSGRVGEPFDVKVEDGQPLALELVETTVGSELGGAGPEGQERRQFSLFFHGPAAPHLAQGSYELTNEGLGELTLFLVPLGPRGDAMRYEAAFA